MNLLYLAHRIPYPPDKGDKIRSFHQVRGLSERHTIHLVTFADAREDLAHAAAMRRYCRSVEVVYRNPRTALLRAGLAVLTGDSLSAAAFHSGTLQRAVEKLLATERIDAAIVFSSAMAQYLPYPPPIPLILDMVDVDSEKWRRYGETLGPPRSWIYQLEGTRLASFEDRWGNASDRCVVAARAEAVLLEGRLRTPVSVLTNGVDLEYLRPAEPAEAREGGPDLVFVGMMDYFPNEDAVTYFASQVLPLVRSSVAGTTFTIVGRNPTSRVRSLSRLPGVRVTGAVPDVRPHVAAAALSVAPFRIARGIQNKVLEAMAMARPVVGTALGFQGLSATVSDGIHIADDSEGMAREIVALLNHPEVARERGRRARAYVERAHRWDAHVAALESMLEEARSERDTRAPGASVGGDLPAATGA